MATPILPQTATAPAHTAEYVTAPRLAELLTPYERALISRGRRPRGIARYLDHLRHLFASLSDDPTIADLTTAQIRAYQELRASSGWSSSTVLGALTAVRSFCGWAVKQQFLADDPTAALDWPKKYHPAPKPLSRVQLRDLWRVLATLERDTPTCRLQWERNRRVIFLMLYAGLRLAEVTALRWADVDLDAGVLVVRQGKGGKDRAIPIHPMLTVELRRMGIGAPEQAVAGRTNGQAYTDPQALAHIFERAIPRQAAKLGFKLRFSAHQLRHTFATEMLRNGADLPSIQGLLGHASLETTQCYLLVSPDQFRAAVEVLPAGW